MNKDCTLQRFSYLFVNSADERIVCNKGYRDHESWHDNSNLVG